MTKAQQHILILPRWYPNKTDKQLGIFIKKQALLVKDLAQISVIYVQAIDALNQKFVVQKTVNEGINEYIVYFQKSTSPFRKIINFSRYKKAQKLAYSQLDSTVDLCHVHVPIRPSFIATHLLKTKKIPFVITEHWSGHLTGEFNKKSNLYKLVYKHVLSKASKISCVSTFLMSNFKSNTGFDSQLLPNYIETRTAQPNIESDKKLIHILSVNDAIDSIKNISGIIRAFKTALQSNPNLKLTLIGGGPDETQLKTLIESLAFSSNSIEWLGRLENNAVLEHMQNCDFYISNSNFETFGMTIAEALLAGKPVISTESGGPNEFITSSNSLITPIKNEKQLTLNILKMANEFKQFNSSTITNSIETEYGQAAIREKLMDFYTL